MPTATWVSGYDLVNLGPLTTTFTAPPECTMPINGLALGLDNMDEPFPLWQQTCTTVSAGSCWPSGSARDGDFNARDGQLNKGYQVYYFSPAAACPSGWTTAGTATRKKGDDALVFDGIFDPGFVEDSSPVATIFNPLPNLWMHALDPDETGIACCPSGYTAGSGLSCYSRFPATEFPGTTACGIQNTNWPPGTYIPGSFVLGNHSLTGIVLNLTTTLDLISSTTTFAVGELTTKENYQDAIWVGIAQETIVFLAHGGPSPTQAVTQPELTAGPDETGGTSTTDDETSPSTTGSAAARTGIAAGECVWGLAVGLASSLYFLLR